MAANDGAPLDESMESLAQLQAVEIEILDKCRQSPDGTISMSKLLTNQHHKKAMPGLYLLAATNLCSQSKVRLHQETPKEPNNLNELIISLRN